MVAVYLFCLGVGGVLLLASFFSDADAPDDIGQSSWADFFSIRNLTYFLFVFGAIGSAAAFLRDGRPGFTTLIVSAGAGLLVSAGVSLVFRYLRRTDTAEVPSDRTLVGQAAQVTLPVGIGGIGKVELLFGGQRVELLARPFDAAHEPSIETGSSVVIVEMDAGTALVSRASLDT
jgi:hypothetical protein